MRKEFSEVKSRYSARKLCPWSTVIAKVNGGFMCFESGADYLVWKSQK